MLTIAETNITGILAIWTPGPTEIIVIALAILLLFGGKKLPELAKGLGRGLNLFRKEIKGMKEDINGAVNGADDTSESSPASPQPKDDDKPSQ